MKTIKEFHPIGLVIAAFYIGLTVYNLLIHSL
jgi:hypothetical protein